jgi:glycolate oxidase FAD binding subunit
MKNVAGYDLSRLMAGAMGTLGILLEVSVKVLPKPPLEHTVEFSSAPQNANSTLRKMVLDGVPITASYSLDGIHRIRIACSAERMKQISSCYGLETIEHQTAFWHTVRDHQHEFFNQPAPLWRLSLPPAADLDIDDRVLTEWAGGLRWLVSGRPAAQIRSLAEKHAGHATLFRHGERSGQIFHPLHPRIAEIQKKLKQIFDPEDIFNPGRHYMEY